MLRQFAHGVQDGEPLWSDAKVLLAEGLRELVTGSVHDFDAIGRGARALIGI